MIGKLCRRRRKFIVDKIARKYSVALEDSMRQTYFVGLHSIYWHRSKSDDVMVAKIVKREKCVRTDYDGDDAK